MQSTSAIAKAFYAQVFASSPDGILLIDPETRRALLFNDVACGQLGYTRDEFARLAISDYEANQSAEEVNAHVREVAERGHAEFDTRQRTKSGEIRQVHVWAKIIDLDGTPAFYTIFRDVTEQRRLEDALRHSHDLLDRTGRLAKVGGWQLDVDTQTLHWTREVYRIHEVDAGFHPTLENAIEFYAPEARGEIAMAVRAAMDAGTPFDLELPLVTARGRRIWVRAQGAGERRGDRIVRIHGAFQDITERKQTDELGRLQGAALHAAADGIVITDRSGTIEWVNPAFSRLTGYTAAEARGHNPRELVKSGRQTAAVYQGMWETILAGHTWQGQIVNRRKDGSFYTEEQAITPILDDTGAVTHFVAIKKDITERLKLEAQFRQSQKMETVGQLASGIAHDFNNLLTVINGMSELAVARLDERDPLRSDVREILIAGQRAAGLTRQLLAFSRQQILQPEVLDLNTVVVALEDMLHRLLGEDVDLLVLPAPDVRCVRADRGQMEQVLTNLAVNARDAMPEGGRLTVETKNIEIEEEMVHSSGAVVPRGRYVQLAVTDSGTGMDEETRLRVFEPFFTTKDPGRGTGLGLSTAYGIVKQSQGFIWVYSELGHGTSFRIYLPAVAESAASTHRSVAAQASAGNETVLVVEDSDALAKLIGRFLTSSGYTVHTARRADEALTLLARYGPAIQLVLTDVIMPQMSGRQLAERIARIRPGTKILYMSGYTDDTVVRHGVVDARVPFLSKPFTKTTLLQKVREALDA